MFILTTSVLLSSSVSPLERDGARSTLDTEQGAHCETATSSHFVPYRLEEKTGRNWWGPGGAGHS